MDNTQFTDNELDYIKRDIFDSDQDIYVYAKYPNMPKCLPNTYNIACKNLPIGSYSLKSKNIDLHFNTKWKLFYIDRNFMDIRYTEEDVLNFIMRESFDRIMFQVKRCKRKDIERIVATLREQALFNQRKLEQNNQTLIQKDIKKHTDLGEDYNRDSFVDTIMDYFYDNEDLIVDSSKSPKDRDVKYLQLMKLMQDKNRHEIKQQKLDMEACELAIRENNLIGQ